MTPRKHAELIKAWADGAEIQCYYVHRNQWVDEPQPDWEETSQYRIKPENKVIRYRRYIRKNSFGMEYVDAVTDHEGWFTPQMVQRIKDFIRWIDTKWQEVEV